jgi:hypothetical protein
MFDYRNIITSLPRGVEYGPEGRGILGGVEYPGGGAKAHFIPGMIFRMWIAVRYTEAIWDSSNFSRGLEDAHEELRSAVPADRLWSTQSSAATTR